MLPSLTFFHPNFHFFIAFFKNYLHSAFNPFFSPRPFVANFLVAQHLHQVLYKSDQKWKKHEYFINSELFWFSTELFFKTYGQNYVILLISKNMIFCSLDTATETQNHQQNQIVFAIFFEKKCCRKSNQLIFDDVFAIIIIIVGFCYVVLRIGHQHLHQVLVEGCWPIRNITQQKSTKIKIRINWYSTALFFKKYCKNNLILLIAQKMILRFCSSVQTTTDTMFFDISKIK